MRGAMLKEETTTEKTARETSSRQKSLLKQIWTGIVSQFPENAGVAREDTPKPHPPVKSPEPRVGFTGRRSRRSQRIGLLELATVALVATFLGALGARITKIQPVGVNMTIAAQPPVIVNGGGLRAVGVAFFPNGEWTMNRDAIGNVELWARALRDCKGAHFTIVGSTSSVPYRPNSKRSNIELAKNRSHAVAAVLARNGVHSFEEQKAVEKDLARERLLNDHPNKARDLNLEAVARRADIVFADLGNCRLDESLDPRH